MKRYLPVIGLLLAVAWLHALAMRGDAIALLAFGGSVTGFLADLLSGLSPDLVLLAAVVIVGGAAGWPRLASYGAAALLVASVLFRTASSIVMAVHGREFELADCHLIGALFYVWLQNDPPAVRWACIIGAIAAIVLLVWLTGRTFRFVAMPAQRPLIAAALLIALQLLVVCGWGLSAASRGARSLWTGSALLALGDEVVRSARQWLDPESVLGPIRERIANGTRRMASVPHGLELLAGIDVHVLVIESYGRVAWRHAELAGAMQELVPQLEQQLAAAGFAARTGTVAPAVIGGASERSHAELLCGVRVADKRTWQMLLDSELVPLPQRFRDAGWTTVEMLPEMPFHWQQGYDFYGVERGFAQPDLDYHGMVYHFGTVPDQFALHDLLHKVVKPATKPVFTMYVSVTSHAPWSSIPPYVEDWQIDAQTFQGEPAARHAFGYADVPHAPGLAAAYRDALVYSLRTAVGYTCQLVRPSLVIVVGDHQPPISRSLQPPDHSADVPMHILSNRPELLQRLGQLEELQVGELQFVEGLSLPATSESRPMAEFAPAFLQLFSK